MPYCRTAALAKGERLLVGKTCCPYMSVMPAETLWLRITADSRSGNGGTQRGTPSSRRPIPGPHTSPVICEICFPALSRPSMGDSRWAVRTAGPPNPACPAELTESDTAEALEALEGLRAEVKALEDRCREFQRCGRRRAARVGPPAVSVVAGQASSLNPPPFINHPGLLRQVWSLQVIVHQNPTPQNDPQIPQLGNFQKKIVR